MVDDAADTPLSTGREVMLVMSAYFEYCADSLRSTATNTTEARERPTFEDGVESVKYFMEQFKKHLEQLEGEHQAIIEAKRVKID